MFSSLWSRGQIDPTSIRASILSHGDGSDQEHSGGKRQKNKERFATAIVEH